MQSRIVIHFSRSSLPAMDPSNRNSNISLPWKRWYAKKKKCIRYFCSLSCHKDWPHLHWFVKICDSERVMKTKRSLSTNAQVQSSPTEKNPSTVSGQMATTNQIWRHQIGHGSAITNRIFMSNRKLGKWTLPNGSLWRWMLWLELARILETGL
jgi:hypothetical protein